MSRRKSPAVMPAQFPPDLTGWGVRVDGARHYDLLRCDSGWREASDAVALVQAVQDRGSGWQVMFDHRTPPPGAPQEAATAQLVLEGDHPALGRQSLILPLSSIRLATPPARPAQNRRAGARGAV